MSIKTLCFDLCYSSNAYKRYRVLTIILVIVTKSFSKANFQDEFTTSSEGFLLQASCRFWAKQCFLLTAGVISNYSYCHQITLEPMVALGYFTTHHTLQQIPRHHCSNPTLMLLSSTVKEILSKECDEMICKPKLRQTALEKLKRKNAIVQIELKIQFQEGLESYRKQYHQRKEARQAKLKESL
ncbi:hypothetical protein INT48_005688 [Thamnidium elegans]|uniref:Uncharacterized protein n=1 Tax=Thamnidium elegans TaxID=101142 RepID=A0A8H7VTS5_9FUNG|nr:hypothetical protein INT48_005688 [Thamnidium elegans]